MARLFPSSFGERMTFAGSLRLFAFLTAIVAVASIVSPCAVVSCPDSIAVEQKLVRNIAGWTPRVDDTPIRLAGVTFFDGPPEQQASLVYQRETNSKGNRSATWSFDATSNRLIWITCSYSGTNIVLSQPLPKATSQCLVMYNMRQRIAGLPLIER